jgi:hypothetical protein
MSAPIVFMDTECDGLRPDRKVWEVAIVRREPDGRETEWQAFVDIDLSTAEPFGLKVGRFYERHPAGRELSGLDQPRDERGPGWIGTAHAARRVARLTHGAHVVGAVPSFDTNVLDGLLRGHGLIPAWHYHLIDVEVLAVGYLAGRGKTVVNKDGNTRLRTPPYSSDELTEALGVESAADDERHTAMGDVRWVMRMYDAIMGGAS